MTFKVKVKITMATITSTPGNYRLTGTGVADALFGLAGNALDGGLGIDTLNGGGDNDT